MTARRSEVRAGLAETRRYLLSHHKPEEWNRCHAVGIPGRKRPLRLCARCSGIYPGIALGVAYGMGLLGVLRGDAQVAITVVGVGYAGLATAGLWVERQ